MQKKDKLNVADTSAYMKLYGEWTGAKGNKTVKADKLKSLREMFKRLLYKTG